jgi:hypothetical protein
VRDGVSAELTLDVPAGTWRLVWLHPRTGKEEAPQVIRHPGGELVLKSPSYTEDLALSIRRKD